MEAFQQLWSDPARSGTPALVDDAHTYSYGELHAAVGAQSAWLRQRGIQDGDRVAIAMERSSSLAIMILGVMASGGCPCPLEPTLGTEEAVRRSRVAGFKWIVADRGHEGEAGQSGLPHDRWLSATEEPGAMVSSSSPPAAAASRRACCKTTAAC
jgi:acyl-coenzyme A synthetase/AMP-(fatty) acid ligase